MSILFLKNEKIFALHTKKTTYEMQVDDLGHLRHLYYGRRVSGSLSHLYHPADYGFSPNPYEKRLQTEYSLDTMPQEYPGCNQGDFRISALVPRADDGSCGADFCYDSHEILEGKYTVDGMPSAFAREDEAQTLVVKLADPAAGLELTLYYGVFEERDVITRAARIKNIGGQELTLEKAASSCLDIPFGDWDLLHFHGRHLMERQLERIPVMNGIQTISSRRGASSHHHNPFLILAGHETTEEYGECYGVMLVYSGSYRMDVEKDQSGSIRVIPGIHDEMFHWPLIPGESFQTPEVLLTFSHEGLEMLSQNYHRFIRKNICRSQWTQKKRPVLINNWEATYFDFDTDKIISIARQASALGVELLVLDDGWFGGRNSDHHGLGDWNVNEEKLPGGLNRLIEEVNRLGMRFGLWIEPEMVNEDSDLYREHPDWALTLPGRAPTMGRDQLVLDMSRPEVVEYLYERISFLLSHYRIDYMKWDMNRNMTDVYSRVLSAKNQGQVFHRYILGVYDLLERLTCQFPEVLFEGCAGGGGRFDAAMLSYFPQIWCSDDTDAIERLTIQHGTSFAYPVSTVGAHVSACPNHQTGRTVPIDTRAVVAMSGTFGYELDLNLLSEEEKEAVRGQITRFHRYADLIREGDYFRLGNPDDRLPYLAWQFVSEDRSESLVNAVITHSRGNAPLVRLRLRGLDPRAEYRLVVFDVFGAIGNPESKEAGASELAGIFGGDALMYGGLVLPRLYGDYPSVQIYFKRL
ncbi:MAG: alpha-galactosidase [Lachnospiraceae bacterium]|nr:alpha-galactosidase [Lachnospiraceae bacterium]